MPATGRATCRPAPIGSRSTRDFPLTAARDVVPYLARLGVGACYTSPYFTAAPGSTHGYDVVQPQRNQPGARRRRGARGIHRGGRRPRHGAHRRFRARTTWESARAPTRGGTTCSRTARALPAASSSTSTGARSRRSCTRSCCCRSSAISTAMCSSAGNCSWRSRDGALVAPLFRAELPINPRQAPRVYRAAVEPLPPPLGADSPQLHEFLSIISSLAEPAAVHRHRRRTQSPNGSARRRSRARRLARLGRRVAGDREAIEAAVRRFNGDAGRRRELRRAPRAARGAGRIGWPTGGRRRTRSTTGASSTSTRWPDCGWRTRRSSTRRTSSSASLIARAARCRAVSIDHPDGLFDPARYFAMLQELAATRWGLERPPRARRDARRPLYVVAEKILSGRRTAAAPLGCSRHDRLQLPQRSERPVRRRRAGAAHAPRVRQAHRARRAVRRRALCRASG